LKTFINGPPRHESYRLLRLVTGRFPLFSCLTPCPSSRSALFFFSLRPPLFESGMSPRTLCSNRLPNWSKYRQTWSGQVWCKIGRPLFSVESLTYHDPVGKVLERRSTTPPPPLHPPTPKPPTSTTPCDPHTHTPHTLFFLPCRRIPVFSIGVSSAPCPCPSLRIFNGAREYKNLSSSCPSFLIKFVLPLLLNVGPLFSRA